ncbi:hypothetical protein ACH3XW_29075 [Acanthocheilonema viteae]
MNFQNSANQLPSAHRTNIASKFGLNWIFTYLPKTMETAGLMMHMVKFAVIFVTIMTTTTTTTTIPLYVQMDNSNSYRPISDIYEPTATELLIKKGILSFGKHDYKTDPVYKNFIPHITPFDESIYEKKDVPGVLRFGKREGDIPGVLRFGKRNDDIPGVLRFGKRSPLGVLRFGRR